MEQTLGTQHQDEHLDDEQHQENVSKKDLGEQLNNNIAVQKGIKGSVPGVSTSVYRSRRDVKVKGNEEQK